MRIVTLLGFIALVVACSDDTKKAASPSGGTTSSGASGASGSGGTSSGGTSSGNGTSSGGTSSGGTSSGGTSSGGTSSGGVVTAPDNGLVPADSVWRTTSEWYRVIDTAPTAEHSGEMIAAIKTWGKYDVFQTDFSFNVINGAGATPVTFPAEEEADAVPVPVPAKGYVEGDYAYPDCPDGDDCHMIIFDAPAHRLYEAYHAKLSGSKWSGYIALWKLDKTYPRSNRGQGCTSADAAGLPIAPGLIGYQETKKGTIHHALRFIIQNEYIRGIKGDKTTPNVVYPASHGSTAGAAATGVPYGARLRLKSTILATDPRLKTPGAKALATALKKYGMILADGGNIALVAESAKVYADANPAEKWDGLLEAKDLGFLRPSDFEVIAIPKDNPSKPDAGWYQTKADYNGQLKKPLGCDVIVQP